ncbi:MAG: flagellar motor switch protein FliM [Deltaproteobacteria bacterium]|nr:flagellar motor switch protein FliM [Deltaproteobacteria bacterium]
MVSIKSFDFGNLPHLTDEETGLASSFYRYLSPALLRDEIQPSLQELLTTELGTDVSFQFDTITTQATGSYLEKLPPQGVFLVLGLPPMEERAFVEIDSQLAFAMIDRLLGGGGEVPPFLRALTEIEQGVFSYLLLKILARFYERCDRSAKSHFRLYEIRSSSEELASLVKPEASSLILMINVTVGDRSGYCRFIFPAPFVQRAFSEPVKEMAEADHRYEEGRLQNYGFVKTDLWAEVGRTTVRARELESLNVGDVVLFDQTSAEYHEGKVQGQLTLRIGLGQEAAYPCEVIDSNETLHVRLN